MEHQNIMFRANTFVLHKVPISHRILGRGNKNGMGFFGKIDLGKTKFRQS